MEEKQDQNLRKFNKNLKTSVKYFTDFRSNDYDDKKMF